MPTKREMFYKRMATPPSGPVLNWEFGFWNATLDNWHAQGLPVDIDTPAKLYEHVGIDSPHFGGGYFLPAANFRLAPGFADRMLEVRDDTEIRVDTDGVTYQVQREGDRTIPHYLDYPIKSRDDWQREFRKRLDADNPDRYPHVDWEQSTACMRRAARRDFSTSTALSDTSAIFWALKGLLYWPMTIRNCSRKWSRH